MQKLVTSIIIRDCFKILPEATKLEGVSIKADRRFGLNIVTSPRFICTMTVTGLNEGPSGVKVFVKSRPNVNEEFNNMHLLWTTHYAHSQRYHIPEPLYLDQEHGLLFMSHCPGETLLPIIYKTLAHGRRRNEALLERCIENAARWLVDFQRIYSSDDAKKVPPEMLDFEAQLTTVTLLEDSTRRRIIDKMHGLTKALPALRDTYVHDQYLLRNILYKGDEVCVVDFPHFRIGWPLYDFLTFYTGIERLKQYPLISDRTCDWMKTMFAQIYYSNKGMNLDAQELENLWVFFLVGYVAKRYKYQQLRGVRGALNNQFVKLMFAKLSIWSKK